MKMRFFDFEVTPNWWLCVMGDLEVNHIADLTEDVKTTFTVISSDTMDARSELMKAFKEPGYVLVGYNIKRYDLIIANSIYQGFNPPQVKLLNDMIIVPDMTGWTKEHYRLAPFLRKRLAGVVYQDLLDDNDGALKEKEAILGLDIKESTVDFNTEHLTDKEKEELIYYCKHDVYACMYFYLVVMKGYVANKLLIAKKFGIPEAEGYMCTNAQLVGKALGARRIDLGDHHRIDIELPSRIQEYVYDNLPSKVVEYVRNNIDGTSVTLFENTVDFSNGGIHSVLAKTLYVASNDEWALFNVDGTGFYPAMLDEFKLLSRAVRNPERFSQIRRERTVLKYKENKTQDEEDTQLANKLVTNTTFGASGNKYLDLYDPYQCTKTCRVGQLFLAAFANKCYSNISGLKIIQTNTDGVLFYMRRKDLDKLEKYMDEWSRISGIGMELKEADKIWQKDVNNYLMTFKEGGLIIEDGKPSHIRRDGIKRKGLWLMETWEKPGYFLISPLTGFVSAKAAIEWLTKGTDIVEYVVQNKYLPDFAITCKKGPSFRSVIQRYADGSEVQLFKCNRVYASKDESLGQIYKIKYYKGSPSYHKMPNIPDYCRTINNALPSYNFKDLKKDLDYMYYINRAADLVDIDWLTIKDNRLVPGPDFKYND